MEQIFCKTCNTLKNLNKEDSKLSDFYYRYNKVIFPCKACKQKYYKNWYIKNTEYHKDWRKKNPSKNALYTAKYRGKLPSN